jgi:hypothetical protein
MSTTATNMSAARNNDAAERPLWSGRTFVKVGPARVPLEGIDEPGAKELR